MLHTYIITYMHKACPKTHTHTTDKQTEREADRQLASWPYRDTHRERERERTCIILLAEVTAAPPQDVPLTSSIITPPPSSTSAAKGLQDDCLWVTI